MLFFVWSFTCCCCFRVHRPFSISYIGLTYTRSADTWICLIVHDQQPISYPPRTFTFKVAKYHSEFRKRQFSLQYAGRHQVRISKATNVSLQPTPCMYQRVVAVSPGNFYQLTRGSRRDNNVSQSGLHGASIWCPCTSSNRYGGTRAQNSHHMGRGVPTD